MAIIDGLFDSELGCGAALVVILLEETPNVLMVEITYGAPVLVQLRLSTTDAVAPGKDIVINLFPPEPASHIVAMVLSSSRPNIESCTEEILGARKAEVFSL